MIRTYDNEVWLAVDSSGFGGIESHILNLATALGHEEVPVRVIFLKSYRTGHAPPLQISLHARSIPFLVLQNPYTGWHTPVKKFRPAVIHTHGYKANIIGRLIAKFYRIRCISTFHSGDANTLNIRIYRWIDEHTARLAYANIAVSAGIAKRLPSSSVATHMIPNFVPVNAHVQDALPPTLPFIFAGRLSHEKGPDMFVELARNMPSDRFAVYGDGPMHESLAQPVLPNIIFYGQVATMAAHWPQSGLLVMTSRQEGLPLAALEAMAHGIPVATFAVGGLPDLIKHRHNGYCVEPGNLAALQECLQEWSALTQEARNHMRRQAHQTIKNRYAPDVVLPRIKALYHGA